MAVSFQEAKETSPGMSLSGSRASTEMATDGKPHLKTMRACSTGVNEAGPTFLLRKLPCQSEQYDSVGAEMLHMFKLAEYRQDGTLHSASSRPAPSGESKRLQIKDKMFLRSQAFKSRTAKVTAVPPEAGSFAPVGSFGLGSQLNLGIRPEPSAASSTGWRCAPPCSLVRLPPRDTRPPVPPAR